MKMLCALSQWRMTLFGCSGGGDFCIFPCGCREKRQNNIRLSYFCASGRFGCSRVVPKCVKMAAASYRASATWVARDVVALFKGMQ